MIHRIRLRYKQDMLTLINSDNISKKKSLPHLLWRTDPGGLVVVCSCAHYRMRSSGRGSGNTGGSSSWGSHSGLAVGFFFLGGGGSYLWIFL